MKTSFTLADFVPYLLNRAGVKIGLAFARDLEALGVTLPMWRIMVALWENGDQRLGDIAERTSIDLSTVSRQLVKLQRKHFVVRQRSGRDGRALSVSLTEKGRSMAERIIPIAKHYEAVATRDMSPSDLQRLNKMLIKIFANMHLLDEEFALHQQGKGKKIRAR
jgi:MarR family transcriptional regulator, organic hydroperoxide resistance regulator